MAHQYWAASGRSECDRRFIIQRYPQIAVTQSGFNSACSFLIVIGLIEQFIVLAPQPAGSIASVSSSERAPEFLLSRHVPSTLKLWRSFRRIHRHRCARRQNGASRRLPHRPRRWLSPRIPLSPPPSGGSAGPRLPGLGPCFATGRLHRYCRLSDHRRHTLAVYPAASSNRL